MHLPAVDGSLAAAEVERAEWLRIRRPAGTPGVMLAHGRVTAYALTPRCHLISLLAGTSVEVVRGRKRLRMFPGQLGLWDPSHPQHGRSVDGAAWEFRLLVVELPSFADVVADPEGCLPHLEFPSPVRTDPTRAARFLRLHEALSGPTSVLERQSRLGMFLQDLANLAPEARRRSDVRRSARRDPALLRACELLQDDLAADISLGDLAAAASTSKFRLLRLFKAGLGVPPHTYQVQLRVQRARVLLEAGEVPTRVAHLVGFYDQSHLNRHFRRTGVTPADYAKRVRAGSAGLEPDLS